MTDAVEPRSDAAEGNAYKRALLLSAWSLLAIAIAGVSIAGVLRGSPGAWGAVAGVSLAALGALVTQGAMIAGYRRDPNVFVALVGGAWLAKMCVIVVGLLVLDRISGIDRPSFAIVAMVGVVVTLGIDVFAVVKARVPYVIPMSKSQDS